MGLTEGARIGPYEIVRLIGAGGMGEVYRARDTRLHRDVAVKVLPASFAADAERLRRFELEAQTMAQVSHPNVVAVFDVGVHEGAPFLVTELLEGETLRTRLDQGALGARRAAECALQIAKGLSAAHEHGIVHRDLKPENVFITRDGRIKVLDFGLAKLAAPMDRKGDATTMAGHDTSPGMVLGTVGYMSPEQVRGAPVDHRADIFAFGAVIYEMLSGRRLFARDTPAESLTAILKDPAPEIEATAEQVPPALGLIAHRCLEKDPAHRFQSASDLAFALETSSGISARFPSVRSPAVRGTVTWLPWAVAGLLGLAALAIAVIHWRESPPVSRLLRFSVQAPDKSSVNYVCISPDGTRLAFQVVEAGGRRRLWIRALDALEAHPLDGTEAGERPFWSPDSRYLGFFAGKQVKKIDVNGGPAQTIADIGVDSANGGIWSPDNTILIAVTLGALQRVPAQGGQAQPLTELDAAHHETRHYFPNMLPDGDHFTFVITSPESDRQGLWVASISHPTDRKRLLPDLTEGVYSQGYLLFARDGTLLAQPFDADRLTFSGEATPIVDHVAYSPILGFADFSVAADGTLAYIAPSAPWRLTWFDRHGTLLRGFGAAGRYQALALSPGNDRVAADAQPTSERNYELFVMEPDRGTTTQVTFGAASGNFPKWSPDGQTLAFASNRDGTYNLYRKPANAPGREELLYKNARNKFLMDWSRDGKLLLYGETEPKTQREGLWLLPLEGDRQPIPYLAADFDYRGARFSPDGRFVAYSSDEASSVQVFVQSYPAGSGKWQISTTGGDRPIWRRDGKELFYLGPGGALMSVDVTTTPAFKPGPPKPLFDTWIRGPLQDYDVTRDGQRFVMLAPENDVKATPATVVTNWPRLLKK